MIKDNIIFGLLFIGIIAIIALVCAVTNIQDIECDKTMKACSVYSRTIFQKPELVEFFNLTEIKSCEAEYHTGGRYRSHWYSPAITLQSGSIVPLYIGSKSEDRVIDMCYRITDSNDYELKGNFFKSFFDMY